MTLSMIAVIVMILGILLYLVPNPKVAEIGRIMFFCGLLVTLWQGGHSITIR